ncbi:hypothetical protein [Spongiactinospora sp. TRM90649]|uniref:hypothetical protein n=1 Tax=Spongiactinospora sp. TRM90649 TaxID=3031114 RepID=UPI0023F69F9D|nr:hypothetical protein [Spongiactinospora sp. TRM90649]MDF5753672.1 hypothetical protein [Spongiactinospora sp. TRM90649]
MNRRALTVTAVVIAALAAASAVAVALTRAPADPGDGTRNPQAPADVSDHWTGERMREATGG